MLEESLEKLLENLEPFEKERYDLCNPNKSDNTYKQLRDLDYVLKVFGREEGIDVVESHEFRKEVMADVNSKMKASGATKITSVKFKAKYWNKYHYIKKDNCHILYTVYGKGDFAISAMQRIPTNRGSVYVMFPNNEEAILIHHHVFERYELRAGVANNDRTEAIKWILKELNHAAIKQTTIRSDQGFMFKDIYITVASGLLLGNSIRNISFFKTYISMDMLDSEQDKLHEESWNTVVETIKKQKRSAPIV